MEQTPEALIEPDQLDKARSCYKSQTKHVTLQTLMHASPMKDWAHLCICLQPWKLMI